MDLSGILTSVCNFLGNSRRLVSVRVAQTDTRVWAKGRGGSSVRLPPTKHSLYVFRVLLTIIKCQNLLPLPPSFTFLASFALQLLQHRNSNAARLDSSTPS